MSEPPIFASMSAPPPVNPVSPSDLQAQIDALVNAKLSEVEAKYGDRIKQLEEQLKAQGPPATAFTAHAAGPDYALSPSWSQALQEASRNGTLTADMLRHAGMSEDAIAAVGA